MENLGFDQELRNDLQNTYEAALLISKGLHTPEQIKLMVLSTCLTAMANTFLKASGREDFAPDFNKVALALLGTSDWIQETFEEGVL